MDEIDGVIDYLREHVWRKEERAKNPFLRGILRAEVDRSDAVPTPPAPTAACPSKQDDKPVWNSETGELTIDGGVAKRIKNLRRAVNITLILSAFEEEGWPLRITDPLPHASEKKRCERLGDALKSLNDSLIGIKFRRDGSTEGIRWERATIPGAPPKLP
jgi:hypothetical protein